MTEKPTPPPRDWPLSEALDAARDVVAGNLGILDGCIKLASLAGDIVPDWTVDPDFRIFGSVASDTDHLPFGTVRARWSDAALARAGMELALIEADVRTNVIAACQRILARFEDAATRP